MAGLDGVLGEPQRKLPDPTDVVEVWQLVIESC